MRRKGILNKSLNEAIDCMGHGDIMIIADAGLPIPENVFKKVDLAIAEDLPDIASILRLVCNEFIYENCSVAEEQKQYNPIFHNEIISIVQECSVKLIPHSRIINNLRFQAKVIIRTGAFMPWGNIILYSGIAAPKWFEKAGVIIPDYYEERAGVKNK